MIHLDIGPGPRHEQLLQPANSRKHLSRSEKQQLHTTPPRRYSASTNAQPRALGHGSLHVGGVSTKFDSRSDVSATISACLREEA